MNSSVLVKYVAKGLFGNPLILMLGVLVVAMSVYCIRRASYRCENITDFRFTLGFGLCAIAICLWASSCSLGDCPNCGEKITETYCGHCGLEVIKTKPVCPNCNEKCYTTFCEHCGTLVEDKEND